MAAEKNRVKYRSSSVPGLNVDAGEKEASLNTTTAGQGHDHKNQVVPHCKPREDHYCIYNPDFALIYNSPVYVVQAREVQLRLRHGQQRQLRARSFADNDAA